MDWTGGTRRLYASKAQKDAVIQRQKNYFAKARASAAVQSAGPLPDAIPGATMRSRSRPSTSSSVQSRRGQHVPLINSSRLGSRGSRMAKDLRKRTHTGYHPPSSSRDTTRRGSSHTHRTSTHLTGQAKMSDEDRLLMANRQRLLARKDWLGLAPTRPLHMTFPSEREGRIGKRRKVAKQWLQKREYEIHRQATPAFQAELPRSGALCGDDMRIKVGTDAFASQTQPSRVSSASLNTSLRHPSTEFGPISEESMLLDVEDGELGPDEPDFSHIQEYLDRKQLRPPSIEESPNIRSTWDVSRGSGHDSEHDRDSLPGEIETEHSNHPLLQTMVRDTSSPSSDRSGTSARVDRNTSFASAARPGHVNIDWQQHDPFLAECSNLQARKSPAPQITTSDDERKWRRAVGVHRSPSAHASVAVLRSDSLHATQSSATYWQQPDSVPYITGNREGLGPRTTFIEHPDRSQLKATIAADQFHSALARLAGAQQEASPRRSPMVELGMNELNSCPRSAAAQKDGTHRAQPRDEEAKDEALWRSFIVGSQQSGSSEEWVGGGAWNADMMEDISPASPSFGQQACSDRVTIGDTTCAVPSSTDCASLSRADSKTFYDNTSLLGHATTAVDDICDNEGDVIYDDREADSVGRQTSVRPGVQLTTSILNARRFKRPKRPLVRQQPSILPASRFLPCERQRSRRERSVYDTAL